MLDVHPPHEAVHTWRDFFIHIATIVIGLLIAVGLEQTVESIHHHREASELRKDLHAESEQIVYDAERTDRGLSWQAHWLDNRIRQVKLAVWNGIPLPEPDDDNIPYFASPDDPIWRSVKASALVPRLTQGEVNGFSEIEYVANSLRVDDTNYRSALVQVTRFGSRFPTLADGQPDFTRASRQELLAYLDLLTQTASLTALYLEWDRILMGAAKAQIAGKTRLEDFYDAEIAQRTGKPVSR